MNLFGQKWFYSGKSCCIEGKSYCISAKLLYSGKSGCNQAKWFYLNKSGSIRAKLVVFGQKYRGQKLLYFG